MDKFVLKSFIFLFLLVHNNLYACRPIPEKSYLVDFKNFVFVMLSGEEEFISESGMIYGLSGLYKNDGNYNGPVWTVDWYINEPFADFYLDDNEQYLIQVKKSTYPESIALAFYDQGKLLKEYKVNELIKDVDAIWDDLHECFPGEWAENVHLENNKATIETKNNEHYVFDLKTGEILESEFH